MCVCVCVGGRERIGQRKDFSKSSVALKERLYLARLRGLVNMYFVKQTAIAMGTPEIARKSKGEKKKKTERWSNVILSSADSKNSFFPACSKCYYYTFPCFDVGFYFSCAAWICSGCLGKRLALKRHLPVSLCLTCPGSREGQIGALLASLPTGSTRLGRLHVPSPGTLCKSSLALRLHAKPLALQVAVTVRIGVTNLATSG